MRTLKSNLANMDMILTAVVAGIVFAISIAIIYSVLSGIDYTTIDATLPQNSSAATNASEDLATNLATFFTLGPIYIVVVAAVGIIAAIMLIRGRR